VLPPTLYAAAGNPHLLFLARISTLVQSCRSTTSKFLVLFTLIYPAVRGLSNITLPVLHATPSDPPQRSTGSPPGRQGSDAQRPKNIDEYANPLIALSTALAFPIPLSWYISFQGMQVKFNDLSSSVREIVSDVFLTNVVRKQSTGVYSSLRHDFAPPRKRDR
jgi:hypothetical protein